MFSYNKYSTEEVNTGKTWINGKPIYRKVFTGLSVQTSSNAWQNLLPNNENIDVITDYSCWNRDNYDYDVNTTSQFIFRIYNGYIQNMLVIGFIGGFKNICLEYIKTTDQAIV